MRRRRRWWWQSNTPYLYWPLHNLIAATRTVKSIKCVDFSNRSNVYIVILLWFMKKKWVCHLLLKAISNGFSCHLLWRYKSMNHMHMHKQCLGKMTQQLNWYYDTALNVRFEYDLHICQLTQMPQIGWNMNCYFAFLNTWMCFMFRFQLNEHVRISELLRVFFVLILFFLSFFMHFHGSIICCV